MKNIPMLLIIIIIIAMAGCTTGGSLDSPYDTEGVGLDCESMGNDVHVEAGSGVACFGADLVQVAYLTPMTIKCEWWCATWPGENETLGLHEVFIKRMGDEWVIDDYNLIAGDGNCPD